MKESPHTCVEIETIELDVLATSYNTFEFNIIEVWTVAPVERLSTLTETMHTVIGNEKVAEPDDTVFEIIMLSKLR
ncbi:hypothetical protein JCM16307_00920 [Thermococcus prieurii]